MAEKDQNKDSTTHPRCLWQNVMAPRPSEMNDSATDVPEAAKCVYLTADWQQRCARES